MTVFGNKMWNNDNWIHCFPFAYGTDRVNALLTYVFFLYIFSFFYPSRYIIVCIVEIFVDFSRGWKEAERNEALELSQSFFNPLEQTIQQSPHVWDWGRPSHSVNSLGSYTLLAFSLSYSLDKFPCSLVFFFFPIKVDVYVYFGIWAFVENRTLKISRISRPRCTDGKAEKNEIPDYRENRPITSEG